MIISLGNILNKYISDIQYSVSTVTNIDIESITKDELLKYERLVLEVNDKITKINSLINTMNTFTTVITNMLTTISVLPIPTSPFPITVGSIMVLSELQRYLKELVNNIQSLLSTISPIVSSYEVELNVLETNLSQISTTFVTKNGTTTPPSESKPVSNYKGYNIYIKEDSSGLLLQSRGVAKDVNGNVVLETDSSHVTDKQILIDKVKFLIDKNNL